VAEDPDFDPPLELGLAEGAGGELSELSLLGVGGGGGGEAVQSEDILSLFS
jgi:hypothetical protein